MLIFGSYIRMGNYTSFVALSLAKPINVNPLCGSIRVSRLGRIFTGDFLTNAFLPCVLVVFLASLASCVTT